MIRDKPIAGREPARVLLLSNHPARPEGHPGADSDRERLYTVEEVPVPPWPLEWPVIVKPATQDASVGRDQGSVLDDQDRLAERVAYLLEAYGPPVLVEQFIPGREFNVALVEIERGRCPEDFRGLPAPGAALDLHVLPTSEILFTDTDPGYWPIVTYDSKWKPGTRDYERTPPNYRAQVT